MQLKLCYLNAYLGLQLQWELQSQLQCNCLFLFKQPCYIFFNLNVNFSLKNKFALNLIFIAILRLPKRHAVPSHYRWHVMTCPGLGAKGVVGGNRRAVSANKELQ